jgi:hypothetical protein
MDVGLHGRIEAGPELDQNFSSHERSGGPRLRRRADAGRDDDEKGAYKSLGETHAYPPAVGERRRALAIRLPSQPYVRDGLTAIAEIAMTDREASLQKWDFRPLAPGRLSITA